MNAQTEMTVTAEQALEALDSLDDYARMDTGVDAIGPREVLQKFIAAHLTKPDAGGGEWNWPMKGAGHCACRFIREQEFGDAKQVEWCGLHAKQRDLLAARNAELAATPSDVPAEPVVKDCFTTESSVVPMPEPALENVVEYRGLAVNRTDVEKYYSAGQLTAYADARVSEATREMMDGLRHALAAAVNAQNILMREMPNHNWHGWLEKDIGEARTTLTKYTQKESK
jgi:hypothetical protein